jgi:topoisomerase IA-like protein
MARPQQRVLDWNGKDVPKTLQTLPEGRYVIEKVTPTRALTLLEEEGLRQALDSVRDGRTTSAAKVHAQLRTLIKRGTAAPVKRTASRR